MGAGFYLEASHPGYVKDMSVEAIAEAIAADCGVSEDDPEVCAGIIGEIGVSKDFTPAEEKVLRGAARASRMSGAPLSIHLPGWERLAHRVLDVVESEGADLRHTVLCHMNPSLHDMKYQRSLADRGAFIEYDMIGMDYFYADQQAQSPCDEENAIAICKLVEDGYLNSLLMSQDVFLKMMLTRYGGFGYGYILKHFVPRLKRHGMNQATIDHILIENPRRVFSAEHRGALEDGSHGGSWMTDKRYRILLAGESWVTHGNAYQRLRPVLDRDFPSRRRAAGGGAQGFGLRSALYAGARGAARLPADCRKP